MANHVMENEYLRVTIADEGAELISVWDKTLNQERIWTADPVFWNRHAPILFPFVGKVFGGKYRVGDKEYDMKTQHGFARDKVFACMAETASSVTHCLTATEETLAIYPYQFKLTICHKLEGKQLTIEWEIANLGENEMYYSIGGHPGLMAPAGIKKEDCLFSFPGLEEPKYLFANDAGYILPELKTLPMKDGFAAWQSDIPATWIFEDHQVKTVGIAYPDGKPYVTMYCEEFPMLAIWANPDGPFICLEPWVGRADDDGFAGGVEEKKDMQRLGAGEKQEIAYTIDFH